MTQAIFSKIKRYVTLFLFSFFLLYNACEGIIGEIIAYVCVCMLVFFKEFKKGKKLSSIEIYEASKSRAEERNGESTGIFFLININRNSLKIITINSRLNQ